MILRFQKGVRVFWNSADSLAVMGRETRIFSQPSIEIERILAAFEKGVPVGEISNQAQMIGVSEEKLADLFEELADWLVASESKPEAAASSIGKSETNQFELEYGMDSGDLARVRGEWVLLLSGAKLAIAAIAPLLRASGIDFRFSNRGTRIAEADQGEDGWNLTHRLGTVSSRVRQLSIGFFQEELDPVVTRYWMSKGQPHLAVVFRPGGVAVSRIVEPGKTPCLDCDLVFTKLGKVSKASLHFQVLQRRLCFASARLVSIANAEVLNRVLDLIDLEKRAEDNRLFGAWQNGEPNEPSPCGCLIDVLEREMAQESTGRGGSFQTVNF